MLWKQVYPWFLELSITNCEFEDGGTCLWSRSRGGIIVPFLLAVPDGRVTRLRERLHWHRVSRGGRCKGIILFWSSCFWGWNRVKFRSLWQNKWITIEAFEYLIRLVEYRQNIMQHRIVRTKTLRARYHDVTRNSPNSNVKVWACLKSQRSACLWWTSDVRKQEKWWKWCWMTSLKKSMSCAGSFPKRSWALHHCP